MERRGGEGRVVRWRGGRVMSRGGALTYMSRQEGHEGGDKHRISGGVANGRHAPRGDLGVQGTRDDGSHVRNGLNVCVRGRKRKFDFERLKKETSEVLSCVCTTAPT